MSEINGSKSKKKDTSKYVKTFRNGAIAANVFARLAPGGFEYLDFGLSRAWKTTNGKDGYSQNFFAKNQDALHEVVDQACYFIQQHSVASDCAQVELAEDKPVEDESDAL